MRASRGGRGGGRGGRRGGYGAPWSDDPTMKADSRPIELFPPYTVPAAAPLTGSERSVIDAFLLVREQIHAGPLYTQTTRTWKFEAAAAASADNTSTKSISSSGAAGRAYGQDQINRQYGVRNKATIDPFTAVPMYAHRFETPERALPDLAARPFSRDLFPPELRPTLDGLDRPGVAVAGRGSGGGRLLRGGQSGKVLALSDRTARRTAAEIFHQPAAMAADDLGDGGGGDDDDDEAGTHHALAQLEKFKNIGVDNEDNVEFDLVEDEGDYEEVEDEEYDDDEEGDYNAEAAFDNGDDDDYGDDFGEDGGGGDEGMY